MPGFSDRTQCALVTAGLILFLAASSAAGYYLWRFGPTLFTLQHSEGQDGPSIEDEQVRIGRALYVANCAQCHGAQAEGNPDWKTVEADGTYLPPPHDSSGHTWHHSDRLLFRIIKEGGQAAYGAEGFESRMPAFGDALSDDDIEAILGYFKSMWGSRERDFQSTVSEQDRGA